MQEKIIYVCENCGKEFASKETCEQHEDSCVDKIKLYTGQLSNVVDKIKIEYGSNLTNIRFNVTNKSFETDGHYCSNYDAHVVFVLANGNKAMLKVNPYDYSESYQKIKTEINKRLSTKYEGVITIQTDMGIYDPYIGDIEFLDIAQVLQGRKVRLEVIE